jgi:MFS family permease
MQPHRPDVPLLEDANERKRAHRKLLAAGLIGSSIEWYDFFIYGTAAALVFPHVFFPEASPLAGTLLSFSTFWAGFVARPIGGVLAGHYGDKIGRKPMVVICLLGMGVATFLIGCLPSASTIGYIAPILLVILRFAQGMACGGQWGGIVLLLTESAGPKKRGFSGTFGQMGVPLGVIFGNLVFLAATAALSMDAFLSWGWRVPFWCSVLLFPVVLYVHTKVEDTPEFRELQEEAEQNKEAAVAQAPLAEAIKLHWRKILLGCGLLAGTNSVFYISIAGLLSYGTTELGMNRNSLLAAVLVASGILCLVVLWAGSMSDRIGRRPLIMVGGAGVALFAFPYFWLVDTANVALVFVALAVSQVFTSMIYGPLAAFMGELFEPRVRYSGASLAYQLAAITISGGTPFIMTAIIANTGSTALVSVYLVVMGAITLVCAWVLHETNPAEVRRDPNAIPGEHLYA